MNRGTVILLALAILLAHTFAIHQTPDGELAAPHEMAHAAFRLGRNLVFEGTAAWNPGGPPHESYPSPLWVLWCAAAARAYVSPFVASQGLGLLAALATIVVLAQFSPKRSSGLIAPVLLAASGSVATAAFSGTEATLAMMLVTTTFLAFERGHRRLLALAASALVVTVPEGVAVLAFLLAGEGAWRPRGAQAVRPPLWGAYALPVTVALGSTLVRRVWTGQWLSPSAVELWQVAPERWRLGGEYLAGFALSSGFTLLVLVVVLSVCAGRSSAMGTRALALVALWWGLVALAGADELPFWSALVPVLPLFFLGVQECLRVWMDERAALARVAWPVLALSLGGAFLASKVPSNLGPLALEDPLTRWQTPRGNLAHAYPRPHGRLGLLEEIRSVENLRRLGLFLRQRTGADAVILTSSPGAIGYLSRREVRDLSGRAWPVPGEEHTRSWRGGPRIDLLAAMESDVDYIVPLVGTLSDDEEPSNLLREWLERYDRVGPTPERQAAVLAALDGFALVSVPVPARSRGPLEPARDPFPLLQRKDIELIPALAIESAGDRVRILARHEGSDIVADLCVRATRPDGSERYLAPTGRWDSSLPLDARTNLLLVRTGPRSIQMIEARVPPELRGAAVTAWLHNPGMRMDAPLAPVGTPVTGTL
ncbi:MAG TPA: hypothetical protein VF530_20075 [Planctomycetota bacterium]